MMTVKFDFDKPLAAIRRFAQDFPKKVEQALYAEAEVEATECRRRTPVKWGNLKGSIHVGRPASQGRVIVVYIYAGGVAAPYALFVHEDLEAFHPIGEAKFIEGPLKESAPHMADRVAKRLAF